MSVNKLTNNIFKLKYFCAYLFIFLLFLSSFLYAKSFEYLNINAKKFKTRGDILTFEQNVLVKRNKDFLKSKKLILKFKTLKNGNKKIIRYTAIGKANLRIIEHNNVLIAKGDEIVYSPLLKKYVIYGNGYLKDTKNGREMSGDKIFIDLTKGTTKVDGSGEAPVEFIIKADD